MQEEEKTNKDNEKIRLVLHRAFIILATETAVHSSSLAVLLTQRADDFGFCFHLPLHKKIIEGAKKMDHSSTNNPVSSILEIVSLAAHSLFVALEAQFFEEALQTFIRQRNYSCAMKLLIAMEERHEIFTIPVSMLVDFLEIIQQNLNESSSSYLSPKEEENLMTAQPLHEGETLMMPTKKSSCSW